MAKYDRIAKHFFERRKDKIRFDYNRDIEIPAMVKLLGRVRGKMILDIGCGFGDHARKLRGYKRYVGIDESKRMIRLALSQTLKNCEFRVSNMDKKLEFANKTFDIVFSSLAIDYSKNLKKVFGEINRVLKKDGIFAFSTGHPIFNLMNQSKKQIIGVMDGKIYGNYFDECEKINDLGSIGKFKMYNYTTERYIKTALSTGFELIDYVDARPVRNSRKYNSYKYRLTNTLPTFILFKFMKK